MNSMLRRSARKLGVYLPLRLAFLLAGLGNLIWPLTATAQNVTLHACSTASTVVIPDDIAVALWATAPFGEDPENEVSFDMEFLGGLIGTPYNGVMSQYYQGAGGSPPACTTDTFCENAITNPTPVFNLGTFDTPTPTLTGQQQSCQNERHFVDSDLANNVLYPNVVFVVQLGPGTIFNCNPTNTGVCQYHNITALGNHYIIVPYQSGQHCFGGITDYDDLGRALHHEYGELITDPDGSSGWFLNNNNGPPPAGSGEIADKCSGSRYVQFAPTGTAPTNRAMTQMLWSNETNNGQGNCVWGFSQDWANFYLASNGEIMREPTFQSSADVWATPTTPFVSAPAVASWGNQRYDLFAYDRNGHLGHLAQSTRSGSVSWDDWGASPAGSFEFKPTVTSWGNSRLDLFATTGAGFVYHLSFDNGTKSGWTNLPALPGEISPASAPAATSGFWSTTSSNPELDVFVAGADGNLYHSTSSDGTTFSGWVSIGQPGGASR